MANLEERLEALEAQNHALQNRIEEMEGRSARRGPVPGESSVDAVEAVDGARVDRRSLLRNLGGAAAAGVGLFAAQAAISPQPALADHGLLIEAGHLTNAPAGDTTTLAIDMNDSSQIGNPAMVIRNDNVGPALRVESDGGIAPLTLRRNIGSAYGDTGGLTAVGNEAYSDLVFFHSGDSNKTASSAITGTVLTTNFAQYLDFPSSFPVRAVETRASQGEKNHPDGSGSLSSGVYTVDISSELPSGVGGIAASITVVPQNTAPGFLRFWAQGTEPDTANLAWSAGQIETTSAMTAVTGSGTFQLRVSGNIHLVVDLVAVAKNA